MEDRRMNFRIIAHDDEGKALDRTEVQYVSDVGEAVRKFLGTNDVTYVDIINLNRQRGSRT